MKKFIYIPLLAFIIACGGSEKKADKNATPEKEVKAQAGLSESVTGTYMVQPENSTMEWVGKKTGGQHSGTVALKSGKINIEQGKITAGKFTIDMTTVKATDMEDPEDNQDLTDHLKDPDFFSVDSFPAAHFVVTKATLNDDGTYQVAGDLTIKGITHGIDFPVTISKEGDALKASADFSIDRTKWNVRYKSKSVLGAAADKFIYDEVPFHIELTAQKK